MISNFISKVFKASLETGNLPDCSIINVDSSIYIVFYFSRYSVHLLSYSDFKSLCSVLSSFLVGSSVNSLESLQSFVDDKIRASKYDLNVSLLNK